MDDGRAKKGYRNGVLVVPVEPQGFFTALSVLEEGDQLIGTFQARKEGEFPRKSLCISFQMKGSQRQKLWHVDVILYSSSLFLQRMMAMNVLRLKEIEEIISINGRPTEGKLQLTQLL